MQTIQHGIPEMNNTYKVHQLLNEQVKKVYMRACGVQMGNIT